MPSPEPNGPSDRFGRVARELADAQVGARVVLPEQHRGVQAERLLQQTQREEHRLVDLLRARAGEALFVLARGVAARRRRGEQAEAARVVAHTRQLAVEARAEQRAHAAHLGAQNSGVEAREGHHEAEVRAEPRGRELPREQPRDSELESRGERHRDDGGEGAREGGDQRKADQNGRVKWPFQALVEAQHRAEGDHHEQHGELDLATKRGVEGARPRAQAPREQHDRHGCGGQGVGQLEGRDRVEHDDPRDREDARDREGGAGGAPERQRKEHEGGHPRPPRAVSEARGVGLVLGEPSDRRIQQKCCQTLLLDRTAPQLAARSRAARERLTASLSPTFFPRTSPAPCSIDAPVRLGLRLQLLLALGALLVLAFVPLFIAVASLARATMQGVRESSAKALGRSVATLVLEAKETRRPDELTPLLEAQLGLGGVAAIGVYSRGKRVLWAGEETAASALPERTGIDERSQTIATAEGTALLVLVPDARRGEGEAVAVVLRTDPTTVPVGPLVRLVALYTGLVGLALLVFAYFAMTRLVVRPVLALSMEAARVAEGGRSLADPDARARESSPSWARAWRA
jgi:hypothetical protein